MKNNITLYTPAQGGHMYIITNKYKDTPAPYVVIVTGIGTYLFNGTAYSTLTGAQDAVTQAHRHTRHANTQGAPQHAPAL